MIKREFKYNLKTFLCYTLLLMIMFLVVFLVYPSISSGEGMQSMDEALKMFPEEILKAFNMDISTMNTSFGWLKTEGFVFVLLIIGVYSAIQGSTILLKEENDKTIEYLNTMPVTRNRIILSKVLVSVIYIVLMVISLAIFNYLCLFKTDDFNTKEYLLISITPLFSSIPLFFLCLFISTFFHKSKKTIVIGLALTLVGYFLQTVSEISEEVEFLKYFSLYTLSDLRNVIVDVRINIVMVIISCSISLLFLGLTMLKYNKKELI